MKVSEELIQLNAIKKQSQAEQIEQFRVGGKEFLDSFLSQLKKLEMESLRKHAGHPG